VLGDSARADLAAARVTITDPLLPRVWRVLVDVAGAERAPAEPSASCPLRADGFWFDSIDYLNAILACEQAFGITFELDSDFDSSRLRTVGDLVELVRGRGGT
jgi:acyl carrier protein